MKQVKLLRAVLVATLAAAFASPLASAGQEPPSAEEPFKVAYELKDLLKAFSEGTAARNECGTSPYAGEASIAGGSVGAAVGAAAGAAAGAKFGAACDLTLGGLTLGLCTVLGTLAGAGVGVIAGREAADAVSDYDNCAGAVYVTGDDVMRLKWNSESTQEALQAIRRDHGMNVRVLAVFESREIRCGAGARAGKGRPAAGIGNTASVAELDALRMCRQLYGDGECRVSLTGRCNSWN